MKVKFYGTRGSIPVPEREFMVFGGNTTCVRVTLSHGFVIIFDAGTGIRQLGKDLIASSHEQFDYMPIILSHTHWDHVQGFPFFGPAYDPRRKFMIAICGKEREYTDLGSLFETQMHAEFFPVPLKQMGAEFTFWQPDISEHTGDFGNEWRLLRHNHPGGAYSYRFTEGDKTFVYCTDIEHGEEIDERVVELSKDADLLIHDAQYTPAELKEKKGWGHSSWQQAIEVAARAGVKQLALAHHDPDHDDHFLTELEKECQREFSECFMAREGQEIEL
jgi:phosphoribosyl 1,2-cyclic phosphodiesterase